MINPRVGLTVFTSSPMILLTIVVLPALSRPLMILLVQLSFLSLSLVFPYFHNNLIRSSDGASSSDTYSIKILSSLSFSLALRNMDSILLLCPSYLLVEWWIVRDRKSDPTPFCGPDRLRDAFPIGGPRHPRRKHTAA